MNDSARLGEALRQIVDHAEALLGALSGEDDERLDPLRERVFDSIQSARARLADMESDANRASERAAAAIERWMQDNPWTLVALGASIGVAAGIVLAGRRRRAARAAPDPR